MVPENPKVPPPPLPEMPPPPKPVTIMIVYDASTGDLNVQGPLDNRMLSYGLLMSAMEAVFKLGLKKQGGAAGVEGGRIVVPHL